MIDNIEYDDAKFKQEQVEKVENNILTSSNLTPEQRALWEDYKAALDDIPVEDREAREKLRQKFDEDLKALENDVEPSETKGKDEALEQDATSSKTSQKDYTEIATELEEPEIAAGIPNFKQNQTDVPQPESENNRQSVKKELDQSNAETEQGDEEVIEQKGESMTTEIQTPAEDKVIAFAKKLHEIAKVSGLPSDQEEMPIQRYIAQNEDDYRLFMDAMKNLPAITAENQDLIQLPQTAQIMQGVELLAWYAGGFKHPKKEESVQMLHDLADKGYPQAQVHYVNYLMAHMVTEESVNKNKDEIRYYYDQLQANKSLPDTLKNSREYMRVFKFMHEVKDIDTDPFATRPELIKWEEGGKVETHVPPKNETEQKPVESETKTPEPVVKENQEEDVISGAEQPVAQETEEPQTPIEEEMTPTASNNNQDLTWARSPLIEDKKGEHNWHFDDKGQIYYDMTGLSAGAREQVQQILGSHGVKTQDENDALYLKNPKQMKFLKKAWVRAKQYTEYNKNLLLEPKSPLIEWNSPGMEKYWCSHHNKYYLNIDGFDPSVIQATEQYLRDMKLDGFGYAEAPKDLKTKNPEDNSIIKGQRVIVIEDREDIKKLKELWAATKRAPELANPPKGMLPNGMPASTQDIVSPEANKTGKNTKKSEPFVDQLNAPKDKTSFDLGIGKQLENIGDSFLGTLAKFTDSTLGKGFNSPEEFGEEFLYQMMAFPLNWMKAYLDTIAKAEKKDPAKEAKALAEKNNALLQELAKKMGQNGNVPSPQAPVLPDASAQGENAYTPEQHQQRVKAIRDYFNTPENADKKAQLKKQFAEMVGQNPELFKKAYETMFPNAPFGFEEAMGALNGQSPAQSKTVLQPTRAGAEQPHASPEVMALMERVAQLEEREAASNQKLSAMEEENKALRQKLAEREQGKTQPVQTPIQPEQPKTQTASQPENPTPTGDNSGAQPPVPPSDRTQTSDSEKVVIRDLNTLDVQMQSGEVVARLEKAKQDTNDAYTASLIDIVQTWYQTPADKRQGDLNELIRTSKDVEVAESINNAVADGYDKNTGIYKKTIELKDAVDQEKVLTDRERLIDKAQQDLAMRRPDLFNQMNLTHDEKGEAVLSIGELNVQDNNENKFAPNPADELKFSTKPESKLDEVFNKYNLSRKDIRDLRIILTYFEENTKQASQAGISMAQTKKSQSR